MVDACCVVESYDLGVIGSGSAAFAAALEARAQGRRVVLAERGMIGGTCVNVGCVPSKALLAPARRREEAADTSIPGLAPAERAIDTKELARGIHGVVDALQARKYRDLAARMGIDIVYGEARFIDEHTVATEATTLAAERWIVATGASPVRLAIAGLDPADVWTATEALTTLEIPERVAIIGAGAIGLELATAYVELGSTVRLVDVASRAALSMAPEIASVLERTLAERGVVFHLATSVARGERTAEGFRLELATPDAIEALEVDRVIAATGRRPTTEGLGLAAVGVELGPHGEIATDETLRTTNPMIFAAGDVTGGPQYVYYAAAQGRLAARNALTDGDDRLDPTGLPAVIFTDPPAARVGMTLEDATAAGIDAVASTLELGDVPRAIVEHKEDAGLVTIVAERASERILGVHTVGPGADDVIQAGVLAIRSGLSVSGLADSWAPYLTMAEALRLCAQSFHADVANLSCCA